MANDIIARVKVTLAKSLQFTAEDDYGHKIVIDTEKRFGGLDEGFRPAELLMVSLAGCMGMDIVSILQKKGGKIDSFVINVEGFRAVDHPHKYNKIKVKIGCDGDYKREDLLRSFELSRDKYCSVVGTLNDKPELEFIV
jgi:putative redox protein